MEHDGQTTEQDRTDWASVVESPWSIVHSPYSIVGCLAVGKIDCIAHGSTNKLVGRLAGWTDCHVDFEVIADIADANRF